MINPDALKLFNKNYNKLGIQLKSKTLFSGHLLSKNILLKEQKILQDTCIQFMKLSLEEQLKNKNKLEKRLNEVTDSGKFTEDTRELAQIFKKVVQDYVAEHYEAKETVQSCIATQSDTKNKLNVSLKNSQTDKVIKTDLNIIYTESEADKLREVDISMIDPEKDPLSETLRVSISIQFLNMLNEEKKVLSETLRSKISIQFLNSWSIESESSENEPSPSKIGFDDLNLNDLDTLQKNLNELEKTSSHKKT